MSKVVLSFLVALSVWGCASGPRNYTFERTRIVQHTPEVISERIMGWCAANGFVVKSAYPTLIYASSDLKVFTKEAYDAWSGVSREIDATDCGRYGDKRPFAATSVDVSVSMSTSNVAGGTQVTIAVNPALAGYTCVSTGLIEEAMFGALQR